MAFVSVIIVVTIAVVAYSMVVVVTIAVVAYSMVVGDYVVRCMEFVTFIFRYIFLSAYHKLGDATVVININYFSASSIIACIGRTMVFTNPFVRKIIIYIFKLIYCLTDHLTINGTSVIFDFYTFNSHIAYTNSN